MSAVTAPETNNLIMDGIVIKIINVLTYALALSSTVYGFVGAGADKETYITPAAYAYYIWTLIHGLLFGFVLFQWTAKGKTMIVDRIQWRFALLGVLNTAYGYFGARQWHITAFVFSILTSASVTAIYYIVRTNHTGGGLGEEVFVHLPFSLYHAWALVLVVFSGFEAFGREIHHHAGVGTKVFVFLALLFLEATAVGYAFSSREGDIAGAATLCWVLWAIFAHQTKSSFIHWSALVFAIISTFWVAKSFLLTWKTSGGNPAQMLHDEERQPLINN